MVQTEVQQSAETLHGPPSSRQEAHMLVLGSQRSEQQSAFAVQALGTWRQVPAWQWPAKQLPLQHAGAPPPQKRPFSVQLPVPQRFCVQVPVQHCEAVWQRKPSGWQALPQTPPLQGRASQQSPAATHAAPWGLQLCPPQKPSDAHGPEQQAVLPQGVPSGVQLCPPQKPALQGCPAQHSVGEVQAAPKGVHCTPPQKPAAQSSPQQSVVSVQGSPSG